MGWATFIIFIVFIQQIVDAGIDRKPVAQFIAAMNIKVAYRVNLNVCFRTFNVSIPHSKLEPR